MRVSARCRGARHWQEPRNAWSETLDPLCQGNGSSRRGKSPNARYRVATHSVGEHSRGVWTHRVGGDQPVAGLAASVRAGAVAE